MAKFGYKCECGWRLRRGNLTRKQYTEEKRKHAYGDETAVYTVPPPPPCKLLAAELKRTAVPA